MIRVKNATKLGYSLIGEGGVLDLSFPDSKTRRGRVIDDGKTAPTLDTGCEIGVVQIGQIYGTDVEPNPQAGRVYDAEGISPTLDAMRGGNRQPKIAVRPCLTPDRAEKRQNGRRFKDDGEESFTLTAQDKHGVLLDNGQSVKTIRHSVIYLNIRLLEIVILRITFGRRLGYDRRRICPERPPEAAGSRWRSAAARRGSACGNGTRTEDSAGTGHRLSG